MKVHNLPHLTQDWTPLNPQPQPPVQKPRPEESWRHAMQFLAPKRVATGDSTQAQAPAAAPVSLSDLGNQFLNLERTLQGLSEATAVLAAFAGLDAMMSMAHNLSLPPQTPAPAAFNLLGAGGQAEQLLHDTLTALPGQPEISQALSEITQLIASMLAGLQGRPGLSPAGYPPGSFRLPAAPQPDAAASTPNIPPRTTGAGEAGRQERAEKAKQIQESGALGAGASPKPKEPAVSEAEKKAYDAAIAGANDDKAVALSRDPKAMAAASPEQKARLIKVLMAGHTTDEEDRAIVQILKSCTSKAEYEKVAELAGGKKAISDELDDKSAKGMLYAVDSQWAKAQKAATNTVLNLLSECDTEDEAKELAAQLGALQLKHQIQDREQLQRLEALAKRFHMPALGYGLPPEVVTQKRAAISQAVNKEDSDLATKLAEDREAMKVASPSEKAQLIRELQRGWTKDRQDVAVFKILSSCGSKAEFDEVMQLSGGREVLGDVDHAETRGKMNELFGAWGRADLAEDKTRAAQFKDVMADPVKQAALASTRPPTEAELNQVGGNFKIDAKDLGDPAMRQADQALGTVRKNIQTKAFDVDWDPQAKTELVLEQRRREVEGRPKLDYTKLTVEADKITSDPDFGRKVADFQRQYNGSHPLDQLDEKKAKEKYVEIMMDGLRKQNGLSEQTMKSLVTQRMGQIYTEGASEMSSHRDVIILPLKKQLAEVEETKGPNSPEAIALRERIAKVEKTTGEYANHLGSVGEIHKNLFKVPPSFFEDFVSAFKVIGDVAAAVASCIPGVGQAVGAAYFGIKAIAAAAKGDVLGVFSSIASAIPGVGGAIGGATGAALNTAGRLAQTGIGVGSSIAEGNVMGALGSIAGLGSGMSPVLDYAQRGMRLADGISRGDIGAIAGAAGSVLGPLANNPAVQGIVRNPVVQGIAQQAQNAAPFLDAIAKGDMGRALGSVAGGLGPLAAGSPEAKRALDWINDGSRLIDAMRSGAYGKALGDLGSGFERMGASPEAAGLVQSFGQVTGFLNALGSNDPAQLARALGGQDGFLRQIGGGELSKAFAGVSGAANQLLGSPQFHTATDLARSGSRFLGMLGAGDPVKLLEGAIRPGDPLAAATRELTGMLAPAAPLIQSMARGDYQRSIEQLRQHPLTSEVADQLALLGPFADLAQPQWLDSTEANLRQLAQLDTQLRPLLDLEKSIQQLQQRFGDDVDGIAQHLLARSGFTGLPEPTSARTEDVRWKSPRIYV
ncbi:MAG: hypothetical protein HYR60_01830 [Acidobacteria bacterium]|nr:hypothetical protein [Acidobacteriota bacterium]